MAGRILVTGASGFVGAATVKGLSNRAEVVAAVRRPAPELEVSATCTNIGDIHAKTAWKPALAGVEVVVHAAARVHVMQETAADPPAAFRAVNVDGTLNLARQAAENGVKRFIFISSIKVNGENTSRGMAFTAEDQPAPHDAYGISKWEAELGLLDIGKNTGMEIVILRPPLVYGPLVQANFVKLMRWLERGIPLPFASIHNRRSLISVDNLVDVITVCSHHPRAANQIFMLSDDHDLSTPALMRALGTALGKPALLFPVPEKIVENALILMGKTNIAERLCRSLQADISKTKILLGWAPPISVEEGIRRTADWYLNA